MQSENMHFINQVIYQMQEQSIMLINKNFRDLIQWSKYLSSVRSVVDPE